MLLIEILLRNWLEALLVTLLETFLGTLMELHAVTLARAWLELFLLVSIVQKGRGLQHTWNAF